MKRKYYFILLALIFGFSGSNMYAQHVDTRNQNISNDVRVPQGISPNGDGLNDNWVLQYFANQTGIAKVEIFDRRGVLVYEKNDYIDEFVGKNNKGNDLPAATYYYIIKLKDGRKLTGWLFLAR